MTTDEIKKLYETSKDRVHVRCDEYHSHSARQDCLAPVKASGGDERDVTICKLVEQLFEDRTAMKKVVERFEKP